MSALRPLFAAAGVLLLVAVVMLGIRSTNDEPVPSTDDTTGPVAQPTDEATGGDGPAEDDGRRPSDDTACGIACGDDTAEPTPTATDDADDGGSSPSSTTACGIACGDEGDAGGTSDGSSADTSTETSTDGGTTGSSTGTTGSSDDGDAGSSSDDSGTEDDDRTIVAIGDTSGDVDDMPDTGGGLATVLGGALAMAAGARLGRRR